MDLKQMKAVWEAYLEVQEKKATVKGKHMSNKQKAVDVDGDEVVDADDMNKMRKAGAGRIHNEAKKKLSPAQKKHFDKDNDGDIDDKDMAMLNKEGTKVECPKCEGKGCDHCDDNGYHMKEANEPTDKVPSAPSRKGDKKNHDAKQKVVAGDPDKHSKGGMAEQLVRFSTFMEKVADEWPYKDEFNFKGKNKPAQDNEPLGQSKTDPNTKQYEKHNESSTEPEGLVDKESPKSKEFIRQHQKSDKNFEVKYDQSVDDVSRAGGEAVKSQAPNRRGTDQLKNGDTKPVKGNKVAN